MNTWVAKTVGLLEGSAGNLESVDAYRNADGTFATEADVAPEGICASSCAYAFIGGFVRNATSNNYLNRIAVRNIGRIAVHQFYADLSLDDSNKAAFSAVDRSMDQITTGLLLEYVLRMGIKPEFVAIASKTPPWQEIHLLSDEELRSTGVENADRISVPNIEVLANNSAAVVIRFDVTKARVTARLYCKGQRLMLWVSRESTYSDSLANINTWSLYDNWSLETARGKVSLVKVKLDLTDQGHKLDVVFQIGTAPISDLLDLRNFVFQSFGKYTDLAANDFSFNLPADFRGLNLLPRLCLKQSK
jgi:hypothetical protein